MRTITRSTLFREDQQIPPEIYYEKFSQYSQENTWACNLIKRRLQHRCFPVNIEKFLKKPILKNICVRLLLKRLQEVIDQDFLSGESLSKTSRLSNITKIPFAFKPEPSLNLTPTIYFEIWFPIIIINGYDRKASACSPWTSCYCYFK